VTTIKIRNLSDNCNHKSKERTKIDREFLPQNTQNSTSTHAYNRNIHSLTHTKLTHTTYVAYSTVPLSTEYFESGLRDAIIPLRTVTARGSRRLRATRP
jgi:hypothetical protein